MLKLFIYIIPLLSLFLPNIWVNYILRKNNTTLNDMPFTGREIGNKILEENNLKIVSIESIKDALFNGDTFVWFKDLIIGKEESILPIIKSNLNLKPLGYLGDTTLLEIEISNLSSMPFSLHYTGNYTFHKNSKFITIPKKSSIIIQVKTVSKTSEIKLAFEILNAVSGLKESPKLDYNLKIQ